MDILAEDGAAWLREFALRARPYRVRWRRQRLVHRLLATLWMPLLGIGLLVAILRFTLVDLPEDPSFLALPVLLWLGGIAVSYLVDRPSLARVARALDDQLELDERLGTALAFAHQPVPLGATGHLVRRQRVNALEILDDQGREALRTFRPAQATARRPLRLAVAAALAVGVLLVVPSPVAGQRAEQTALRQAGAAQAAAIARVRRELVARPELSADTRALLDAQLAAAQAALEGHPTDRAAAVAALSQADDALRGLLPDNAAQVRAARNTAAQQLESVLASVVNDPAATLAGNTDLEKAAAAAANALSGQEQGPSQNRTSQLALASSFDQIAAGLDATDPALAEALRQTADALRQSSAAGLQAMQQLAQTLGQTAQAQAASDLIAGSVAQLDTSKQQVAEAGLPPPAVANASGSPSFGRQAPNAGAVTPVAGPEGSPGAGTGAQNSGAQPGSGPASGGQSAPAQPGSGPPAAGAGSQPGTGGATQLQSNVQGGGGTQASTPGAGGTGTGRVSVSGTDSGAPEATGTFEPVFVPDSTPAPTPGGPQDQVLGVESPGQSGGASTTIIQAGPGYKPGVKTPYNKVIGQYRDAAAQALDNTTIPVDARQYVRDYFDSIAPAP